MYNVSSNFKDYIKMPSRTLFSRIVIGTNTYTDTEIVDMSLESNLVPGDEFTIGNTICNKFEATLITTNPIYALSVLTPFIGLNINGTVEEVPLGVFNADPPKVTKSTTKIVAYDNMIKFEKAYFSDLNYPATVQSVATEICQKAGVSFSSTLQNYSVDKIEGKTLREALGIIAGICGGFARINRVGNLEIVSLTSTDIAITTDNFYGSIEKADKNFTIKKITAIREDNSTISSGSGQNYEEITFSNNHITQAQLDAALTTYSNYSYRPIKFTWQGNPAIDVGDKITITDIDNTVYSIPVMRLKLTYQGGLKSEISSIAKGDSKSEYDYKGPVSKKIERLVIEQANIKVLVAEKATIDDLTATNARIENANINIASINTLLAGNLSAANMQAGFITATSGLIANGAISDAMIQNLSVSKVLAGDISTNKFRIVSDSGYMLISDNTIQIKDASRVRVQIGKDASNDYNMYVWDALGNLMFDATGLKSSGIKDKIIRDDMVSDTANINGSKIEKESLVTQINGATTLLKATKIKLDTENQTLDVAFTSLKSTVTSQGNTVTSQGTAISTIQGQINSKIWSSDITTAVNNVQVSGRNLLKNSKYLNVAWGSNTGQVLATGTDDETYNKYTPNKTGFTNIYYWLTSSLTVQRNIGSVYVISCDVKTNNSNMVMQLFANHPYAWDGVNIPNTNGKWQRVYAMDIYEQQTTDNGMLLSFSSNNSVIGDYLYAKNYKIEEFKGEQGIKTSAWTPAPEDTDAQITTISNNYTSLNQTVNSISANVSSLQTTTSDLGTRMTNAESQLSIQAGQITSKVSQTDINNSINALQIGYRNLITKSNTDVMANWSNETSSIGTLSYGSDDGKYVKYTITTSGSMSVYRFIGPFMSKKLDLNKNYTVSAEFKTNGDFTRGLYLRSNAVVAPHEVFYQDVPNTNGQWERVSLTFKFTKDFNSILIDMNGSCTAGTYIMMRNPKIEEGDKASDYTVAPEDVQGQIDTTNSNLNSVTTRVTNAESNINQLSNSISLKVSTTDFTSYKTSNDSAVSSLTSRISAAELKITSDAIVSTVRTSSSYTNDLAAKANVTDVNSQITQLSNSITSKVSIADFGTYITQNVSSVKIAVGQIGGNNLIKNGGFEFGTTGWGINNNPSVLTDQTWQIYQGKTCFIGTNDTNGSGIYQSFPTIVGKKYTVQFVLLVDGYHNVDGTVGIEGVWAVSPKDVMSWTKYTYTFTATNTAHVFIAYANAGGSFYIDNIQVEEGENTTAWSANENELKSASFEVTDQHARFTSPDGSYTEFVPGQTGLKWHKNDGATSYDYNYLIKVGEVGVPNNGSITIPLPSEWKDKNFSVSAAIKSYTTSGIFIEQQQCWVIINKSAPSFTVQALVMKGIQDINGNYTNYTDGIVTVSYVANG